MPPARRIYLDNAATSWPKPAEVLAAVGSYMERLGAPAGRAAYAEAVEVSHQVAAARKRVAEFIGAEDPSRIVFTFNGTDSLNLALRGLPLSGAHVVTTVLEHNSVLRPLTFLHESADVGVSRIQAGRGLPVSPGDVRAAMTGRTTLVALTHASNVTGALQPVAEVATVAREYGALMLVDAAQTAGHVPIHVQDMGIDLLACSGHKGLLGPLGTGFLYIRPGVEERLTPLRFGGTGTMSELDRQPETMPDKYESGNLNVPGILGLAAGIEYLCKRGLASVRHHELELTGSLLEGLGQIAGVNVHSPRDPAAMVGVVSITVEGLDPAEVAALLDGRYGIQARTGLHCAPLAHRTLGTAWGGGTVRFSVGAFNTMDDVGAVLAAVRDIAVSAR